MSPAPLAEVDLAHVDGVAVVIIEVEQFPAHDKPCFVVSKGKERGSYERRADGDHRMGTYQVFLHSINIHQPDDDTAAVEGATPKDLDQAMIERMLQRLRRAGRRVVADVASDVDALRRLNVLVRGRDDATAALTRSSGTCAPSSAHEEPVSPARRRYRSTY